MSENYSSKGDSIKHIYYVKIIYMYNLTYIYYVKFL